MVDPKEQLLHYNALRNTLIKCHSILTETYFEFSIPPANFLTTDQLKNITKNDPLFNIDNLSQRSFRTYTVEQVMRTFKIMGDQAFFGLKYPKRDCKIIYEACRDWIKCWIDVKERWGYYPTPPMEELELVDLVCRFVYQDYLYYYLEDIDSSKAHVTGPDADLLNIMISSMIVGKTSEDEMSYVDYLGEYKERMGYSQINSKAGFGVSSGLGFGG